MTYEKIKPIPKYIQKMIEKKDFDGISALAEKYVSIIQKGIG